MKEQVKHRSPGCQPFLTDILRPPGTIRRDPGLDAGAEVVHSFLSTYPSGLITRCPVLTPALFPWTLSCLSCLYALSTLPSKPHSSYKDPALVPTPHSESTCLSSLFLPCIPQAGGQTGENLDLGLRDTPPLKASPSKKVVLTLQRVSDSPESRCYKKASSQRYPCLM